jgi:hypothetical protein
MNFTHCKTFNSGYLLLFSEQYFGRITPKHLYEKSLPIKGKDYIITIILYAQLA